MPGVAAVVTAEDTPKRGWGAFRKDQAVVAFDRVRYAGEEVAAVAAEDVETARAAVERIEVDWEELPAVLTMEAALAEGAPLVHDAAPGNVTYHFQLERGDVDAGFVRSDVIVEGTWQSSRQWHAAIETIGCLAEWDALRGRLTLSLNTQTPFLSRGRYAWALGLVEADIRVVQTTVGGGFGGKSGDDNAPLLAALLARKSGRPVLLVNSRQDVFLAGRPRIPMRFDVRLGFSADGHVQAKEIRILADNGAYTGKSIAVMGAATVRHDALYRYPAVRANSTLVYTNLVPTGAFRGFGNPSADWAVEQAWDMAAERLGMDVVDLLLLNAVEPGDISPHNHRVTSCELKQCISRAAELIDWRAKRSRSVPNRGVGIACSVHVSGRRSFGDYDGSSALVRLNEDGRATIISGEGEIGQGAATVLCQIAAEEIGLALSDVLITDADTDLATHALGALASRVTYVAGNAVRLAASSVRDQLLHAAAEQLEASVGDLAIRAGHVHVKGVPGGEVSVGEVARKHLYRPGGGPIVGVGQWDNPSELPDETRFGNESGAYNFIAEAAEVEVDPSTGQVTVLELAAVVDCGTVINPMLAEGQVEGGIAQGLGLALSEGFAWSDGRPEGANFGEYKIPTAADLPWGIHVEFAESYEPSGPFGAKGVGEIGLDAVPACVANAIYDAVGVRICELPITAEKVHSALRRR